MKERMCPDCPAEIITQNILRQKGRSPAPSRKAALTFVVIRGMASRAITQGAVSGEEVKAEIVDDSWEEEDSVYGDLPAFEIVDAAVNCALRISRGDCGFHPDSEIPVSEAAQAQVQINPQKSQLPLPTVRPSWLDQPLQDFRPGWWINTKQPIMSATKETVHKAIVTEKSYTTFGQLPLNDGSHESYKDKEHQRRVFTGYYKYLGRTINDDDSFLVISFKLTES